MQGLVRECRLAADEVREQEAGVRWRGSGGRLTVKEGDELLASALRSQREGDGRESMDGIESKKDIIVLESGERM